MDFLIGDSIAIEVKGTTQIQKRHLKGLQVLSEEINLKHKIVVSLDSAARLIAIDGDEYLILPYQIFLGKLWVLKIMMDILKLLIILYYIVSLKRVFRKYS